MTFPAEVADKIADAAARAGVRRQALFAAAGEATGAPLSYSALCALYETAARMTGDTAFGLHVGEQTRPDMYGLLGYAAAHSQSLGDALERLVALQGVWTRSVILSLRCERRAAHLAYRAADAPPADERRHEAEQMIGALLTFARTATGVYLRPLEVRFEHAAPLDLSEHRRIFGSALVFRAATTELVLERASLRLPLAAADPKLGALISGQAAQALFRTASDESLANRIRQDLRNAIAVGRRPSLAATARDLGLGARTLQRRLSAENLSWRELVEEARIAEAMALLADGRLALAQVAHRAGFSQPSAFHRAFRRVVGTTPRLHRLALSADEQRR